MIRFEIEGYDLPGRAFEGNRNAHVGIQRKREVIELVPGDAASAAWGFVCEAVVGDDVVDLRGPYVQGRPGERFVYLSWGEVNDGGDFVMFRRAKLMIGGLDASLLRRAAAGEGAIAGRLRLTDAKGGPVCAAVRPPAIEWSLAG